MKEILAILSVALIFTATPAYAHKLILHSDSHTDMNNALKIPDHEISWAIYENLGANKAKFDSFDAEKGDSSYASIAIPKMEGLEEYSPTLVLVSPENNKEENNNSDSQSNTQKFPYEGNFPSKEFYGPFGQVTYWERQEISTEINADGEYFIVVLDEKNQKGKYSLAIGTIEDFSEENIFLILPQSWGKRKCL